MGHMIPGMFFFVFGALLCFEIGLRTRLHTATSQEIPFLSVPLAVFAIVASAVGIFIESFDWEAGMIYQSWWDATKSECFRAGVANYNTTSSMRATLSQCAMYPLRGNVNRRGHSEHQALYAAFILPAVFSLLHRGAQLVTEYQQQQRRQQQLDQEDQEDQEEDRERLASLLESPTPPTALLEPQAMKIAQSNSKIPPCHVQNTPAIVR